MRKRIFKCAALVAVIVLMSIATLGCKVSTNTKVLSSKTKQVSNNKDNDNMLLGNPSNAKADVKFPDNYLISKKQYTLSYSKSKEEPNWVSWHLDSSNIGSASRENNFRKDDLLPADWYKVIPDDYKNSGFDKGHMCPSADRTSSAEDNSATFLMDNMIPQAPKNNQIVWEKLEEYTRSLVKKGNEIYIISGSSGKGGTGSKGYKTTIGNGVVVPATIWKVIVVLSDGDNDISRINESTRVIAVSIPNTQDCASKPWADYRVNVDSIESLTGYDFLSNVSVNVQNKVESHIGSEQIK